MTNSPFRTVCAAFLTLAVLTSFAPAIRAAEKKSEPGRLPNPFFAYCIGYGVGKEAASLPSQLQLPEMLADLGYAGMAYVGVEGAAEMLEALESRQQKLFAVYTPVNVEPDGPAYDPRLDELIPKLQGHGTIVWLVVNSKTYKPSSTDGDARAVEILRRIADLAQRYGVNVSLYPHKGAYAERIDDVVRLAKKTERKNIGVTFTLCHFMAVEGMGNLERALKIAKPYLTMATVNGTNGYDPKNREGWILTLDQGTFDVSRVLMSLRDIGYQGPIGMIVYGIQGDRRDILARSIQGWNELSAKAAAAENK
ncbi:MAG: sugar phosphate isomerase/epimerase [Rhodopirellula sp.]|nr:sugar phosphate isomerase/epimerase [Rhodopirellula sp.]